MKPEDILCALISTRNGIMRPTPTSTYTYEHTQIERGLHRSYKSFPYNVRSVAMRHYAILHRGELREVLK